MRDYNHGRIRAAFALLVLFGINTVNFYDRQVLSSLTEPLRKEWQLGDGDLGFLGTAFIILYAIAGLPLGRFADRASRKWILFAGVLTWSLLTAASGLATGFWSLFACRLGVGVGEAACAPASASLLGDLFPPGRRGRAMSVFMLGLPAGIALSYFVSGRVAQAFDWRHAFFVAGIPGILCALAVLAVREPPRGSADPVKTSEPGPTVSTLRMVISIFCIPAMPWIIVSGVLLNFCLYALGLFLVAYLTRFHGLGIREAGDASMVIFGIAGLPGLLLGGVVADWAVKRRPDGRLLLGAISALGATPLVYLALARPRGDTASFVVLLSAGSALLYVYYAAVYPSIQDVVEPKRRGTAMAVYFLAMYLFGAAFGPWATGKLSDHGTREAAAAAGVVELTREALEPFRGDGLRSALEIIPPMTLTLSFVLLAASRKQKLGSAPLFES